MQKVTKGKAMLPLAKSFAPQRSRLSGNLSELGVSMVNEEVRWLMDGAWVIASGERVEAVIAGDWPLATLGRRFFARLYAMAAEPRRRKQSLQQLPRQRQQ